MGGFLGNGYWHGYKDLTVTFDGCTAEIASAAGTSVSDTGAFVGDGKDNTFVFTGENRAVTTGTTITELIGKKGTGITVTGEDTVTFLK